RPFLHTTRHRHPESPLFPYTTLFRSPERKPVRVTGSTRTGFPSSRVLLQLGAGLVQHPASHDELLDLLGALEDVEDLRVAAPLRSEEHTSELQSRENLVCRLLLEKKN